MSYILQLCCYMNLLVHEDITALPQGQDCWLEESLVLGTTGEEKKEAEMKGAVYSSKEDSLPEARGASSS